MAEKRPHKARPSSGGTRKYGRSKRAKKPCQCEVCKKYRRR